MLRLPPSPYQMHSVSSLAVVLKVAKSSNLFRKAKVTWIVIQSNVFHHSVVGIEKATMLCKNQLNGNKFATDAQRIKCQAEKSISLLSTVTEAWVGRDSRFKKRNW